jgi:hypothetical protein
MLEKYDLENDREKKLEAFFTKGKPFVERVRKLI